MNALKESAAPLNTQPPTPNPDIKDEAEGVKPQRGVWFAGGSGLVVLMVAGLWGQLIGLRSIDQYSEVRGTLIAAETERDRLEQLNSDRQLELSRLTAETHQAASQLTASRASLEEVRTAEQLSRNAADAAMRSLADAQEEQNASEAARIQAVADRDRARESFSQLQTQITSAKAEEETLSDSVRSLRGIRANLDQTLERLTEETESLATITAQNRAARSELDDLTPRLASAREAVERYEARQAAISGARGDVAALQGEREVLREEVDTQRAKINSARRELIDAESSLAEVQARLSGILAQNLASTREAEMLRQTITELRGSSDMLNAKVEELQERRAKLREESRSLENEVDNFQSRRAVLLADVNVLQQQDGELKLSVDRARSEFASLQPKLQRLEEVNSHIAEREATLNNLQVRITDLRDDESGYLSTLRTLLETVAAAARESRTLREPIPDEQPEVDAGGDS